jgi:oligopeptidase B
MLDPTLSATVLEYDEWGDPNKEEYFDYISSYCPYQNIRGTGLSADTCTGGIP